MFSAVKRVSSILAFGIAGLADLALCEQVENPIKLRLNSDIIKTLFHKGDQRILEAFQELKVTSGEEEEPTFAGIDFSVTTSGDIPMEDYDFDVLIHEESEPDFMGFRGKNLRVVGSGSLPDDSKFDFTVPIEFVQMEFEWVDEDAKEIIDINPNAKRPKFKDMIMEIGSPAFAEGFGGD